METSEEIESDHSQLSSGIDEGFIYDTGPPELPWIKGLHRTFIFSSERLPKLDETGRLFILIHHGSQNRKQFGLARGGHSREGVGRLQMGLG